MSTLNPNLLSKGMTEAMNAAAPVMRALGKRLMTPEVLLLTFIRLPGCTAGQLLQRTADARGFKLADLEREADNQARSIAGRPADFDFVVSSGDTLRVPLSSEMVVVLDEGKSIAQAAEKVWIGTEHSLGAMSQVGVSTSGLLQRYGITPTAMTGILADQALTKRTTTQEATLGCACGYPGLTTESPSSRRLQRTHTSVPPPGHTAPRSSRTMG